MTVIPVLLVALIANLCSKTVSEPHHRPPSIEKQPGFEQLFRVSLKGENRSFSLDCEASGNPEPTFRWYKNGQLFDYTEYQDRISQQPKSGTLVFSKPSPIDEGYYQCYAENDRGISLSNSVFLRKSEISSFIDDKEVELYAEEGRPYTIGCDRPAGYPEPTIIWTVQEDTVGGIRSINKSRLTVDPNGSLHFSNVTKDDILSTGSVYACTAPSFFRDEYKVGKRVYLKLENETSETTYPLVKQYVSPSKISAVKGQVLDLHCIYGGTPLPKISWKKERGAIDTNRYTFLNFDKTLQIKSVDFVDNDTFECTAENGVGEPESNTITVEVVSAPYWIKSPDNINADDGDDVRFECVAEGFPSPNLEWFVNGEPLRNSPANSRRNESGNILTIKSVVESDTAVYQCNASNDHGYAFKDFYVNVLAIKPSIIEKPNSISSLVNSTINFTCRVFGAPKPKIKWFHKDREIVLPEARYHISPKGDLRILNITLNDEGEYTCIASNKFGEAKEIARLEVEYYAEPDTGVTNLSVVATESTGHLAKADWLIGMLCVIALVIILAILVCIVKRNRGGKYSVHEKEAAYRGKEYNDDVGFDEYAKPLDPRKTGPVGSKSSLTSSLKHADGNDADSMTDYGDDDSSKFGEDGSFIGEYGKKKNSAPQPPTFV